MKAIKLIICLLITPFAFSQEELIETMYNQTADEIITKYIDRTGGIEAWSEVNATKMNATFTQGDLSVPIYIYNTRSGKQAVVFEYNKKKVTQMAFDGATMWTTNFLTMEPEISSDDMPLVFDLAQGHFYAGLAGIRVHHNLFPFFNNDRVGTASIKLSPDIYALRCRIHRHFRIG